MAIVIEVTNDRMEAIVHVVRQTDQPLEIVSIERALAESHVVHGIDILACNECVIAINEAPPQAKIHRTLARGTPPQAGEDGRVELVVEYVRNPVGTLLDSGAVDFHDHGVFTPIAKGQLLANIVLPTPGIPGRDVLGSEIKPAPGRRVQLKAGAGTKFEAGGTELRATRDGDLRCSADLVEVLDIIRVPGNLDYTIGNVDCEGPVRIEGDVLPGFHIRSGGDVYIGGVVDSAEVTAGGTITIAQGILGGSFISARKQIKTRYLRDAYIESDADILIELEALNSTLVSGDAIYMTANGRVVGGRMFAQNRIDIGSAGHPKGTPTTLAVGVNPLAKLHAARLAADMERARGVQHRVIKMKEVAKGEQQVILDQMLARATEKHAGSAAQLAKLNPGKAELAECRIKVRQGLHPGVRVHIGKDRLEIQDDLPGATFRYAIDSGQIVQIQNGEKK